MLRPLSVLILLTLMTVLTTLDAAAQSDPIAPTQFTSWTAWTSRTPEGNFALDRCKTLQAGDINGDGLTDLVCPYDYGSASTATFVQISDGESFTSWTTWAPRTPEGNFALDRCKTLQTGDLNGDGLTDLVCPYDYGSASTATFVQISDGESFTSWTAWAPRTPEGNFALDRCKTLQAGDINGDGLTDLVCPYDYGSASTATFVQLSDGESFTGWTAWASRTPEGNFALDRCRALQTGDLNNDGLTDLVCPYDYGSASTATFVQLSDGESFASWTAWAARTDEGIFDLDRCKTLQTGDLNNDGLTDLVCPYDYGSASTATFVQLSDGGSFGRWTAWAPRTPEGNFALDRCKTLQAGDINNDGLTDLVCPYDYGSASTATFVQLSDGESFTGWTAWASRTPEGNFALDRCKTLVAGTANAGRPVDLICPYDYGSASTATFVQSTAAVYELYMPIVDK